MLAVITGASRGIGREIVHQFINKGWTVVGISRSELDLSFRGLSKDRWIYHQADVRRSDQLKKAAEHIANVGKIDLLVNNAGQFKMQPFEEGTWEIDANILGTNLLGTILTTRFMLPLMATPSRIINISSVAGLHGIKDQAVYSASKAGITAFAEALAQELVERRILITTIYPGGVKTSLWSQDNPYPGDTGKILQTHDIAKIVEFVANLSAHIVMKKIVMFPESENH